MDDQPSGTPEMISRGIAPLNLEMPFSTLADFITPADRFYVRNHFPIPELSERDWRLKIEGAVATPLQLTLAELRELPEHTVTATIECAGNGRSFLQPRVKGVEWDLGAVGNAEWTGVLLRDVLERSGVNGNAVEAILEGADRGEIKEAPKPPGAIHYARSLPLAKARGDVLLAYALNGEPLTPAHGFPLRAVVPGWFGMAAVKWLQRIVLTERPFHGYYQSIDYTYWEERDGMPTLLPLGEMQVKAQIAQPAMNETVAAGSRYRVHGAAWGGPAEVAKVEISTDEGASWNPATLLGEPVQNAWRLWEFIWDVPDTTGTHTLLARASDAQGRTQPTQRVAEYGTYMINHLLPITVRVE